MRKTLTALTLALIAVPLAHAQTVIRTPRAGAYTLSTADDKDRAMLGISTSTGGRRDTLGLLITSVTAGSPAEKAGLEEGNRLMAINGVNLKLSRDDANDEDMSGINQNRLTREMRKVKPGDEVSLDVWSGGRARTVKVKTVAAAELSPNRGYAVTRDDDRAALGVFLSVTGNKRDTAGVFVQRVSDGGPADKAGIAEGDRIASINGVDVRVPREDAGDWSVASSRIDRMEREVRKLKPGQSADLVVVSGGRSRNVKVTAVKATEIPGGDFTGFSFGTGVNGGVRITGPQGRVQMFGPDGMNFGPNRTIRVMPRIKMDRDMNDDDFRYQFDEGLSGLKEIGPMIRKELDRSLPRAMDDMRLELNNELPRAMDALRAKLRDELPGQMNELRRKLRDNPPARVIVRPVTGLTI